MSDLLCRLQISEKSKSKSAKQINSKLGKSENEEEVISARSLKDPLAVSAESSKSPHDESLEEARVPESSTCEPENSPTTDTSTSLKAKQSLALDALVDRLSKLNKAVSSVRETRTVKQLVSFTKKQQKEEEDTAQNGDDSKAILVKSTLEHFKTTKSDEQLEKSKNDEGKESSREIKEGK